MAKVSLEKRGGKVFLQGELIFSSVGSLLQDSVISGEGPIVINLAEVTHSDSSGLALLINWFREAKERSISVSFEEVPQKMMALAKVSGLDKVLPIVSH